MFVELQLSVFYLCRLLGVFCSSLYRLKFVPKSHLEGIFFLQIEVMHIIFVKQKNNLKRLKRNSVFINLQNIKTVSPGLL